LSNQPVKSAVQNKSNNDNITKGPMRDRPMLFLDLETTGLIPGVQEILEIGAVLVSQPDFTRLQTFECKVKPVHFETASPEALKICGYDHAKWENAIDLKEALTQLSEIGRGAVLMGFNVTFDWAFLQIGFNTVELPDPFYYHRVDVMSAAYARYYSNPKFSRFSLSECCRYFGVSNRAAHTALSDAEATYDVFVAMMRDSVL